MGNKKTFMSKKFAYNYHIINLNSDDDESSEDGNEDSEEEMEDIPENAENVVAPASGI